MELNYGSETDRQIRTKKASIVVGGNILSRGLTINGLSVTVFGRTAGLKPWTPFSSVGDGLVIK